MIKIKKVNTIDCSDWDELIVNTYGRPYCFQQQEGCQQRGNVHITIPSKNYEEGMNDIIPEVINDEFKRGVKFDVWLNRDPESPLNPSDEELKNCHYYFGKTDEDEIIFKKDKSNIHMFYERNFYPNLQTVANDLHEKGLIEKGDYVINIDW